MECPCTKSETEVFAPVKVQVTQDEGRWYSYNPQNPINAESLDFTVAGNNEEMIDMNNISLFLAGKIQRGDGTNLPADENVMVVNNFFSSLIKHIAVSVNKQLITPTISDFAYKSYVHKLIDFDMPKGSLLQQACYGYHPDTVNHSDKMAGNENEGAKPRKTLIKESRRFEVRDMLDVDFFQTGRLLVPDADITLKIFFNEPKFFLQTAADNKQTYKLLLEEATLYVRKIRIIPSLANTIDKELATKPAIYPFIRREITSYNIPTGFSSFKMENIFRGQLAHRYFIFLVNAAAAQGAYNKNPFELKNFRLSQVGLFENGQNMSGDVIEVDFDQRKSLNAYYQLLESIGALGERASYPPISYKDFKSHSTIFCFTRSPDLSNGDDEVVLPDRSANVTLKLSFHEPTTAPLSCYIIGEFFARVEIRGSGKEKAIVTDFPV